MEKAKPVDEFEVKNINFDTPPPAHSRKNRSFSHFVAPSQVQAPQETFVIRKQQPKEPVAADSIRITLTAGNNDSIVVKLDPIASSTVSKKKLASMAFMNAAQDSPTTPPSFNSSPSTSSPSSRKPWFQATNSNAPKVEEETFVIRKQQPKAPAAKQETTYAPIRVALSCEKDDYITVDISLGSHKPVSASLSNRKAVFNNVVQEEVIPRKPTTPTKWKPSSPTISLEGENKSEPSSPTTSPVPSPEPLGITVIRRSQRSYSFSPGSSPGGVHIFKIVDQDTTFKDACLDLNSDASATTWILLDYVKDDPYSVFVSDKGDGGLEELKSKLNADLPQYALLKIYTDETGYGGAPKIVFITYVSNTVTGKSKGRAAPHRSYVVQAAAVHLPLAGEYPVNDTLDTLTHEGIIGKLTGLKGKDTAAASPLVSRSQGLPSVRAFGGRDSSLMFDPDEETINNKIRELGGPELKWIMFSYADDEGFKVQVIAEGNKASADDFKPLLTEDKVYYVIMRLNMGDTVKVVVITYVGENALGFLKARSAGHRIQMYEHVRKLVSVSGEYAPQTIEELTNGSISAKIMGTKEKQPEDDDPEKQNEMRLQQLQQRGKQAEIKLENLDQFSGVYKNIDFKGRQEMIEEITKFTQGQDTQKQIENINSQTDKEEEFRILLPYMKLSVGGPKFRTVEVTERDDVGASGMLTSEEWREKHLNTKESCFFFVGVVSSEAGYGLVTKWALIQWIGHDIKRLARGQIGELRQTVFNDIMGIVNISGEMQGCTLPEHVTLPLLLEKLTGSNLRGESMTLEQKQSKFKGFGKEKKSKLQYHEQEVITEAIDRLVNEDPEFLKTDKKINWLLVTYVPETIDVIEKHAEGTGGLEEFKEYLKEDNIAFILMRIMHATGYQRDFEHMWKPYYGMILWKGKRISLLEKGLTGHHFTAFQRFVDQYLQRKQLALQGSHYQAEAMEELLIERVKKSFRLFD